MKTESKGLDEGPKASRSRRFVGPGTAAMLIGITCLLSWQIFQPTKVLIDRCIEPSGANPNARIPSITDLLSWSETLELSSSQKNDLQEMLSHEQAELKPLLAEIAIAMTEFDKQSTRPGGRSLAEIQSAARPVSELSFQKRHLENKFAAQAIRLLEPSQRTKALELGRLAKVPKSKSEVEKR